MSKIQIVLAVSGILASIVVAIAGFVLSGRRGRNKTFKLACGEFRAAFTDTLAELGVGGKDVHYLMSQVKIKHEAAIDEFRRHIMRPSDVSGFDAACQKYRSCRDSAQPAILQVMRAQATGQLSQDDDAVRNALSAAINAMLEYAGPH